MSRQAQEPWTIEQVVAIAPSAARFVAAEALALPSRWVALGADDRAAWGRCRGSGREPYDTMVDHAHVAWRCSCPSRSQPCKHALALLTMWVRGQIPAAAAPAGVASWADGHARRVASTGDAAGPPAGEAAGAGAVDAEDDPAPEPDGSVDLERARDERIARLRDGLVDLDRWLDDRLRTGLSDPALARYATWDGVAARLVDARAGAMANRVRRLAGVVGARPDWHEVVLAELGVLHLLAQAGQRVGDLPGPLADAVATACGWQVRQADVLAGVPDTDTWVVAGRSDTREDRIEVRRTWLRGVESGRWAMVLSFAAYRQSLDGSLVVGRALTADLHRYPGPSVRALVGIVHDDGPADTAVAPPATSVAAACDAIGTMLAGEPWADRVPATLLAAPSHIAGRWVLTDDTGSIALAPDTPGLAMVLAASGGQPVAMTVEWTVDGAVPLTVHLADRALDVGPRRPVVRERSMTIADCWQELVTVALLGTDRRDPPELPAGALADVVDDVVASTPSERMLAAVGACTALRRAGLVAHPPAPRLVPPEPDERPMVRPAAARRWRAIVSEWSVLEDEWLDTVERRGWRLSPEVLVGLLRRHRTDNGRRSRVMRIGGPVAAWVVDHQPDLAAPVSHRRPVDAVDTGLPPLAVAPALFPMLVALPDAVIGALAGGLLDGTFGLAHRAVLVNFVARVRPDALGPLADALAGVDHSARPGGGASIGLARSLADLASTRRLMLEELDR